MRRSVIALLGALCAIAVAGCSQSGATNSDGGGTTGGPDSSQGPGGGGGGTCSAPLDLARVGMANGGTIIAVGSTVGAPNNLHPNPGCAMHDDGERVFVYHVPDGVSAVRVSTDGSDFDTVLYARASCDQPSDPTMVMDLACNNDDFDHPPQSTIFVTGLASGMDVFLVVDGNADAALTMGSSSGNYVLTLMPVTPGAANAPCRASDGTSTGPACNGNLGCSQGGAPDGTALCVPTVANGAACDTRGYQNTCASPAMCAQDPSPPDGAMPMPVCSMPGTHAGAPCRASSPRCDAPLMCGNGDAPMCVRVLSAGEACDPMGISNHCPTGQTCLAQGDAGTAMCH